MVDPALLSDGLVLSVAQRVSQTLDTDLDSVFPLGVPARVIIELKTAETITRLVRAPWGEPSNPMRADDLLAKFDAVAATYVEADAAPSLRAGLVALNADDLRPLLAALAQNTMMTTMSGYKE
jgi:2-methylcitrate dehydratase PrpD